MIAEAMRRGIRAAMKAKNMTGRQVCLKAGLSTNQLSRFLVSEMDIKLSTLERICVKGLDTSFDAIRRRGRET